MPKVFISGSRQIDMLPIEVNERIDNMISSDLEILVGDSEKGVDSLVLNYLYDINYQKVTIYSIYNSNRIKTIDNAWRLTTVATPDNQKLEARKLQVYKDRVMAETCDYGLVVWQDTYLNPRFKNTAVSSGSLRNMVQMLLNKTPVTLYHRQDAPAEPNGFKHYQLNTLDQLEKIISGLAPITQKRFAVEVKAEADLLAQTPITEQALTLFE